MSRLESLPLAPKNPLPYLERLRAVKNFDTGPDRLRDAGGPVTRFSLGPRWLMPPMVLVTSPQAIRDVLATKDDAVDKTTPVFDELRRAVGANLVNMPFRPWTSRRRTLQPIFTRQRVQEFGSHMSDAAEMLAGRWADDGEVDLDADCRALTLRALGRSIFGMDLDEHADEVSEPLAAALKYAIQRAVRPIRAPYWLPTPARRRARNAGAKVDGLAASIVTACRADPARVAPLAQALLAARDPETGLPLTDQEICDELIIFLFAGYDTTATTLAYALWALGRNPDLQERVASEVAALPNRQLTADDMPLLGYTTQVIRESLRLCPPAPTGTRMACRDVEVAGHRVETGTMLVIGRLAVQRDPALWADPLTFDPDRFAPEAFKSLDRWQYLPFGGGPRSCIGDHFAMLLATLALATLVRTAEVASHDEEFPVALHFTMIAGRPIRVRVRRRGSRVMHETHGTSAVITREAGRDGDR